MPRGLALFGVLAGLLFGAERGRPVTGLAVRIVPATRGLKLGPGFRAGDTVTLDNLLDGRARLRRGLEEHGYLWGSVDIDTVVDGAGISVRYDLRPGPVARLAAWRIVGDTVPGISIGLPRPGTRFTRTLIDAVLATTARRCQDRGYPLAAVRLAAVGESATRVTPTIDLTRGPHVDVRFVEFSGSIRVKAAVLVRAARFRPAGYSPALLAAWWRNLEASGLARVDSTSLIERAGEHGLRCWITDARANRAAGTVGYDQDARRLTGYVSLDLANLFDTGRRLEGGWQSVPGRTSYSIGYTEPWLLGSPVSITGRARQETTDTLYSSAGVGVDAGVAVATWASVSFGVGTEWTTDVVQRQRTTATWAGTGFDADNRDLAANPRRGGHLAVITRAGTRRRGDGSSSLLTRAELDGSLAAAVAPRIVFWSRLGAKVAYSGAALAEPEFYRMGGPLDLRGYADRSLASTRLGWLNSEIRFLPGRQSRLYPFVDVGVFSDERGWHYRPAYGVGLRTAAAFGEVGIDYGVAFGTSLLNGKVHISAAAGF